MVHLMSLECSHSVLFLYLGHLEGKPQCAVSPNHSSQKTPMAKDQGAFVNFVISFLPSTGVVASQFLSCLLYAIVLCSTSWPLPFPRELLSPRLPPECLSVNSSLNQPLPLPLPLPQPLPHPL